MEKAAASTEVLSHLHDSVHKCSTLTFFTTLTRTWQKIFCCVISEMGTKPSGGHISVTESRLHYFVIVHMGLSLCLFLVSFLETVTPTNNLHLFGENEAFIAAGVQRHDVSVHTLQTRWESKVDCVLYPVNICKHHGEYLTPTKYFPLSQTDRKP